MQTIMLCSCGVFSTAIRCSPTRPTCSAIVATALLASSSSDCLKVRIAPRLGDDLRADMRADLGFIKLDDAIERGGFDISLVDQNGFERAHPEIHLGKIGALIVIVIMFSHKRNIAKETGGVQSKYYLCICPHPRPLPSEWARVSESDARCESESTTFVSYPSSLARLCGRGRRVRESLNEVVDCWRQTKSCGCANCHLLVKHTSPIHHNRLPGHEVAVGGAEKHQRAHQIVRRLQAA